jgi:hypothetical protein
VLAGKKFREGPVRPVDWVVFVMDVIPYLKKEKKILDGLYGGIWFRIGFVRFFVVAERYHVGMITFFLFG